MIIRKEEKQLERKARETFFYLHPHAAYTTWPEEFWKYFHRQAPHITRERMVKMLMETEVLNETKQAKYKANN